MSDSPGQIPALKYTLSDPGHFSRIVIERPLRPYQLEPARAIADAVLYGRGRTFAVMMARQAGKNELSAQMQAYLLNLYQCKGGQIVKASPTYKPQTINSLLRLCDRLANRLNAKAFRRREGYMVELGRARCLFFSADPAANVVGATADLLLEGDEAQEIPEEKWYKDFAPMAASTNATTVLYGTAWTADTLLARTIQHLQQRQAQDGVRRVFVYDADEVAACVPAYGDYVGEQVARLGRDHPLVKTQYFLETIDAGGGLFPVARQALMRGEHPRQHEPSPGGRYALLLDVAGEEHVGAPVRRGQASPRPPSARPLLHNPKRDATALTVVDIERRPGALPHYRTVDRRLWLGTPHTALHDRLLAQAAHWRALWLVVDATGLGAGLAAFLSKALEGSRTTVLPVVFSHETKSRLGWNFVAAVETGRYQDYLEDSAPETRQFWYEVEKCQYEVVPGPGERMRWGVWESPAYDGAVARGHDDLLVSAALCTILDEQAARATGSAAVIHRPDPLDDIDRSGW